MQHVTTDGNREAGFALIKIGRDQQVQERLQLDEEERKILRSLGMITAKPVLYAANVAENGFVNNPYLDAVCAHAKAEGAEVVSVCADTGDVVPMATMNMVSKKSTRLLLLIVLRNDPLRHKCVSISHYNLAGKRVLCGLSSSGRQQ